MEGEETFGVGAVYVGAFGDLVEGPGEVAVATGLAELGE